MYIAKQKQTDTENKRGVISGERKGGEARWIYGIRDINHYV